MTEDEIKDIVEDYTQTNLTFDQLKELVRKINNLYIDKGYITARAYLPEQTIENGKVKIELLEGRVGNITITGNKWTRTSYIEKRINAKKDNIFNIVELEEDMTIFNRYNNGVSLSGDLNKGTKNGTTDITLNVHEKSPFHLTMLIDNAGRDTIGKNRIGVLFQDDSLFGFRDK